jgi:hypothetical protein
MANCKYQRVGGNDKQTGSKYTFLFFFTDSFSAIGYSATAQPNSSLQQMTAYSTYNSPSNLEVFLSELEYITCSVMGTCILNGSEFSNHNPNI